VYREESTLMAITSKFPQKLATADWLAEPFPDCHKTVTLDWIG
jgi:hypothetical protein